MSDDPVSRYRETLTPTGSCTKCGLPVGTIPKKDSPAGMKPLTLHIDSLLQSCRKGKGK